MAKIVKISPITKEFSSTFATIESSLARHGLSRAPGTARTFLPYKEKTNLYRTGFEIDSPQMERLKTVSPEQYEAEVKLRTEAKERLEKLLKVNLNPDSDFYNFASNSDKKVQPVKIGNSDYFLDLKDPMQEITYFWLRVYPLIAPSLEAYRRGEVPADTQFYISDEQAENKLIFSKKKEINKAISKFESMDPETRKRVARLMALPIGETSSEEEVYNIMDSALKEVEFKGGKFKGMSTVRLFEQIANLDPARLKVKDLVEQAIIKNIYRVRANGKVFEGENEIAKSTADLVEYLLDDLHQEDLMILEKKLIAKKIIDFV